MSSRSRGFVTFACVAKLTDDLTTPRWGDMARP
jgi:hypothetical protein